MKIKSPITGKENVSVFKDLNKQTIISNYLTKLGVDVSRFYDNQDEKINIYKCEDTGYKFFYPQTLEGDGNFYNDLVGDGKYYSVWKKEYQVALDLINKIGNNDLKVLDVGCGYGNFIKVVNDNGYTTKGLEFNTKAVDYCRSIGLDVDMEDIAEHAKENSKKYDVVCIFQVLEHVYDVKSFIDSLLSCIKDEGYLVIAVPNNEPFYAGYHAYSVNNVPPHHMGLWNIDSFQKIQPFFKIKLIEWQYDLPIKFLYYLFFKAKYLSNFSNSLISFILGALISPLEVLKLKKLREKVLFGTIITIFRKTK